MSLAELKELLRRQRLMIDRQEEALASMERRIRDIRI
jgi:hypothetical protein